MVISAFCRSARAGFYLRTQNAWVYLTGEIIANVNHMSRGMSSMLLGQAKEPFGLNSEVTHQSDGNQSGISPGESGHRPAKD